MLSAHLLSATQPPRTLLREVAANGSLFEKEFQNYTYQQTFTFSEVNRKGTPGGFYREVREIYFTPEGKRSERFLKQPVQNLERIRLTEEDFRDIREVQPFVLNKDNLWMYRFTYKGVEDLNGQDCYVYRIKPRQVLQGQRLFDGLFWVSREHRQVVQVTGKPVPQIHREKFENLFPNFTTIYDKVDGQYWFPVKTVADDVLPFRNGVQRVRYSIEFENYKRFSVDTTITFEEQER